MSPEHLRNQILERAPASPLPTLQDSHLLRTLMDNTPDAIYFKDLHSRFLCVNRAQARRFGLADPSQAIGKTDADFFSPLHAQQAFADEQQVLRGKPLVGIEEMETWPNGMVTWVSTTKMPLRDAAGQIVGTFGISREITERKQAEHALADRTRQLEHKNQLIEEELKMARELQLAMLPHNFPGLANGKTAKENALEFFSFYFPTGAVSGDFFHVVELSDTSVGVFICDVMGHDVRAALVTAMMRALVEEISAVAADPGQLLAQINQGLVGIFRQTGATMYATAFYLIADVRRGELRYSSAAHPDPFHLVRSRGRLERLAARDGTRKGPALGLFENAQFPSCVRRLETGDLIALFTDGLIEAESPEHGHFSEEALFEAVRRRAQQPARELLSGLIREIQEFSSASEFADDVCLVAMEVKRLDLGQKKAV